MVLVYGGRGTGKPTMISKVLEDRTGVIFLKFGVVESSKVTEEFTNKVRFEDSRRCAEGSSAP